MAQDPFQKRPGLLFWLRMTPITLIFGFGLGILLMGQIVDPARDQPQPIHLASGALDPPPSAHERGIGVRGGLQHWRTTLYFLKHWPEPCQTGEAASEFQAGQCSDFNARLGLSVFLSLIPIFTLWVGFWWARRRLTGWYRQASARVQSGRPIAQGIVTDPAKVPVDLFSWLHCLQPISVQLPTGEQRVVHVPLELPVMPQPGELMLVFEPIRSYGSEWHVGILHLPHVAIVRGD